MCKADIWISPHMCTRIKKRSRVPVSKVKRTAHDALRNAPWEQFECRIVIGNLDCVFRRNYMKNGRWEGITAIKNSHELRKALGV